MSKTYSESFELEDPKLVVGNRVLNMIKGEMLFYGISCVLFWSVLLVQIPFISKFFGGIKVIFYVPMVYGMFSNLSRLFLIYLQFRKRISPATRLSTLVWLGAAFTASGMIAFPIVMAMIGEDHPDLGFFLCMLITALVGTFNSFLVTGGFSLMSLAPQGCGQFFLLGLTATGIITWPLMMFIRKICESLGTDTSTSFWVATITLTLTGVICLCTIPMYVFRTSKNVYFEEQLNAPILEVSQGGLFSTFRKIWASVISLWLSRVITFSLYPCMIGLWSPGSFSFTTEVYRSFMIYLGPVSDTIGQLMYRYCGWFNRMGEKSLVVITVVRGVVLIPLFLMSAYYDGESFIFLASDAFRCALMFCFSCSMGINYSLGNALAPRQVGSVEEKMNVGVILSFVATNGLFVGSLVSIGFRSIVLD